METWELVPFKSIGEICFTDTKEDIISKFGEPKRVLPGDKYIGESFDFYWGGIVFSKETKNVYSVMPTISSCEILYKGLNLNISDYKKIVKELFLKGHEIYGNFSSLPEYVDKNLGIGFITHESNIGDVIELDGLGIWSQEAMPDFNDKSLCPDDILITREDQII